MPKFMHCMELLFFFLFFLGGFLFYFFAWVCFAILIFKYIVDSCGVSFCLNCFLSWHLNTKVWNSFTGNLEQN